VPVAEHLLDRDQVYAALVARQHAARFAEAGRTSVRYQRRIRSTSSSIEAPSAVMAPSPLAALQAELQGRYASANADEAGSGGGR
jgi:hypothetical protein